MKFFHNPDFRYRHKNVKNQKKMVKYFRLLKISFILKRKKKEKNYPKKKYLRISIKRNFVRYYILQYL